MTKRRDRLLKKYRASHPGAIRSNLETALRDMKHRIQKELRKEYWSHIDSIFSDTSDSHASNKKFWRFIKHNRTDSCGINELKRSGQSATKPKDKANLLNAQFESVFTREGDFNPAHLQLPPLDPNILNDITFNVNGIKKLLDNLQPKKAAGPDNINPIIFKTLSSSFAPILQSIFTASYNRGTVPDDWKRANVVPVYKKGSKTDPANYRPISLTCIACKIMEHIITSAIMKHAESNNIFYKLQYGFRSKRSCETQLIGFITDIANNIDRGIQTDVLIMDFSKAFDKVGHKRLSHKLHHYGIRGKTLTWIDAFLKNRKQRVALEGQYSDEVDVLSGVPQGSVLGPSLFLYYINDLPANLNSNIRLFADDTIAYLTVTNSMDAESLQKDLEKMTEWSNRWAMEFHPQKCQVISITRKRHPFKYDYHMGNHILERVASAKYLGLTISEDLRWNRHIDNICKKANGVLAFVKRNLRIPSRSIKTKAYKTIVRPTLEYSASVWDPYTLSNTRKIEAVQRRAARFVQHRYHNTSSPTEMLNQLQWPSLAKRRESQRLCMMHKMYYNHVAFDLYNYISPNPRPGRLDNSAAFQIPHSNNDVHLYSFFPRTIRQWNSLPQTTVNIADPAAFKTAIK
jgi:hypothetical protein